jgi:sigma-B regulation protein RsbU (phosphoserine phosphatase)
MLDRKFPRRRWDSILPAEPILAGIVSGDYYDFPPFDDGRFAILVGDVAGKGVPAAMLMSGLRGHARELFAGSGALSRKIAKLNRAICGVCPPDRFITLFVAIADHSGELVYVNAGHNPPLLVHSCGEVEALTAGGVVLGVEPTERYQKGRVKLELGDTLVLFSDGVTEASDATGQPFGEARLASLVARLGELPAHRIVDAIHEEVAAFSNGASPADDITVVVAKRTGCRRKKRG